MTTLTTTTAVAVAVGAVVAADAVVSRDPIGLFDRMNHGRNVEAVKILASPAAGKSHVADGRAALDRIQKATLRVSENPRPCSRPGRCQST